VGGGGAPGGAPGGAGGAWTAAFPNARGVAESHPVAGHPATGEIVWPGTSTGSPEPVNRVEIPSEWDD